MRFVFNLSMFCVVRIKKTKTRRRTHQIVKSSAHSLGIDPQLPLARVTVPRLAHVVPFEQLLRVIDPVYGVPVDGQRVVSLVGLVLDPRINGAWFTGVCVRRGKITRIKTFGTRLVNIFKISNIIIIRMRTVPPTMRMPERLRPILRFFCKTLTSD